jgi:hypothetical protein
LWYQCYTSRPLICSQGGHKVLVSFMYGLYPRGKSPRFPLDRRLGGPQSLSGRFGEVKILTPIGTWTPTPWSSSP